VPSTRILAAFDRRLSGALVAFADRRLRQRLGARFALLYAVGIGLTYGIMIVLLGAGSEPAARALILRELTTVTWVVGAMVGLSLAADWRRLDGDEGVFGFLHLRGIAAESLDLARWYAAARRIALLVAAPTLLCCALAGARIRSLEAALGLAGLALATAAYACLIGAGASSLALAARLLAPTYGRTFLIAVVLLPHAARELWPALPSVPAGVAWLIAAVGRAGGAGA